MSAYEPGTVAVATVGGVEGIRVMRLNDCWAAPKGRGRWSDCLTSDRNVTDIRPLVVLDLSVIPYAPHLIPNVLRLNKQTTAHQIADQIEAQTRPPRIPEPGLWGVVEAGMKGDIAPAHFVRTDAEGTYGWTHAASGHVARWDDLIDPTLIREGVESDA